MRRFLLHEDYRYQPYDFNIILDLCRQSVRYFTFTEHGQGCTNKHGAIYKNFIKAFQEYKVYEFHAYEWYGYAKPPIKWYEVSKLIRLRKKIMVYKFNDQSIELLKKYIKDLFLNLERWPFDYPEDICFFREDRSLFLGTVSHECIAEFYLTDQEIQEIKIPKEFFEYTGHKGWDCRKVPLSRSEK